MNIFIQLKKREKNDVKTIKNIYIVFPVGIFQSHSDYLQILFIQRK